MAMNGHTTRLLTLLAVVLTASVSVGLTGRTQPVGAVAAPGHGAKAGPGIHWAGRAATLSPGLALALRRTRAREVSTPNVSATTVLSGTPWTQQAELTSTAQQPNDAYGWAVAVSGSTAAIGAPATRPTYPSPFYGAVYLFTRTASGVWQQQAELLDLSYGAGQGNAFGLAVALQGNTLAVGAPGANGGLGAVYLYGRTGSTWTLQTTLTPADATQPENFATALALSGPTLAVGANYQDSGAGAVYVFVYSNGAWSQQAELRYPGHVLDAEFGWAVALWGNTLVVGAPQAPVAFLYARTGTTWALHALLYAPHAPTLFFGIAVAVWGNTVLVGACCDLANRLPGAVYVFGRVGSTWQIQTVLTPTNGMPADQFGSALALSGYTAVVGGAGAYVFMGSGATWTQTQLIPPDRAAYDIGIAVAVQGTTALIGSTAAPAAGYVFVRDGTDWNVADPADTASALARQHSRDRPGARAAIAR